MKDPLHRSVENDTDGKPQRIALQVVSGSTSADVSAFVNATLASSLDVI